MNEMVCASGVDLLMDYLEGVLSADAHELLAAHVASCRRCAAFVESYRATPRIVRDATAVAIPPYVRASLRRRLRAQR
jgi:anti-sigma factor RsiW